MMNKRGQGLQISTIILIVLGLAVLVLLIVGFMTGWQKIFPWLSSSNVDTIVNQCQAACAMQGVYEFCTLSRTLKASDLPNDADGKPQKEVSETCEFFANDDAYLKYNIAKCPDLCPAPAEE